jgi:hypothetical protein
MLKANKYLDFGKKKVAVGETFDLADIVAKDRVEPLQARLIKQGSAEIYKPEAAKKNEIAGKKPSKKVDNPVKDGNTPSGAVITEIAKLPIDEQLKTALIGASLETVEDVRVMSVSDLVALVGLTKIQAQQVLEAVK